MSFNITFDAKHVKLHKNKQQPGKITVEVLDPIAFLTDAIMTDEVLADFLKDRGTIRYLIKKVGTKAFIENITDDEKIKLFNTLGK